jgi:hypothetical protein
MHCNPFQVGVSLVDRNSYHRERGNNIEKYDKQQMARADPRVANMFVAYNEGLVVITRDSFEPFVSSQERVSPANGGQVRTLALATTILSRSIDSSCLYHYCLLAGCLGLTSSRVPRWRIYRPRVCEP